MRQLVDIMESCRLGTLIYFDDLAFTPFINSEIDMIGFSPTKQ